MMKSSSSGSVQSQGASTLRISHTLVEDILALLTACMIIAFGITLIQHSGTLTGGTVGLAFLLHYALHIPVGVLFFTLNLPFYWLAWKRMGLAFVVKTFCSVGLVSLLTEMNTRVVEIAAMPTLHAAIMGNILMGLGLLMLFRHRASLGGFNILALFLQDRYQIRAGKVQMALDLTILLGSLLLVSLPLLAISIVGAIMLNTIITMNHRPQRYTG